MGSLFSSPGKQAQQAAQATGNIDQAMIQQMEGYVDTHQQQLRDAIGGLGPNPYFGAAPGTAAYAVNPSNTVTAGPGALPYGLTTGTPTGPGAPGTLTPSAGNPFSTQQNPNVAPPPGAIPVRPPQPAPPSQPTPGGGHTRSPLGAKPVGPDNPFRPRYL